MRLRRERTCAEGSEEFGKLYVPFLYTAKYMCPILQSCHKCQESFQEMDVVVLNAEGDDLELVKERAILRKARTKSNKRKSGDDAPSEGKDRLSRKKITDKVPPRIDRNEANDPAYKKAKNDYSIAKDPKASEVFKSIFTSHKSATEQDRAHWVTYNPFYN